MKILPPLSFRSIEYFAIDPMSLDPPVSTASADLAEQIDRLVDEYRERALWFLRPDYYPSTDDERLRTLDYIAQRGDLATFKRVAELRQCLLRSCSEKSSA
jgi:hypothetical protein